MEKIRQTKEVLLYNTICNHLVTLTKHRSNKVEDEERDTESVSIEVSGIYYQEEAKEK